MKVLIARLNHETNTFSPVPTPLSAFGDHGPDYGADAYKANKGAVTAMGAFIDLAESWGAEIVTPLSATAYPSGPVDAQAYRSMCQCIVDAAPGCDALMLDLHGAMVVRDTDDGEGDLLERLRTACPGVPIAVSLDLHGNVTQKMIDHADIITGFKTYPHTDMYESGELAGRILWRMLQTGRKPALAWRQLPLMTHTLKSSTQAPAMRAAVDRAIELERQDGIYAVTVMAGFALADIPAPCLSVLAVARDQESAQSAADALARQIWDSREGFVYVSPSLRDSVSRAKAMAEIAGAQEGCGNPDGPVLLLDHSDNCMSGGTCDTMDVLQEALAQGLRDIAVGPLCDPEAVDAMFKAGEGATITLPLGNKRPLTSLGITKTPPVLAGTVRRLGDGEYVISGPTYRGMKCGMGRTALFAVDGAEIVVTEKTHEPWDLGVFTCVGVDPASRSYVLLKSRMYCRPVFFPIARGYVECDSQGVTSSNYDLFPFRKVVRPVYPLDRDARPPAMPARAAE
ncbi:M81 family metallopeptidase [Parapusillimonas granuli]|uniref:Microcystinase C n=1 Tax=Parapusillimonas granuli TaxID=380911 RepID=A0A853G2F9_9BURK|nr:M81 family metallopeptidase [Parapusillimonas granuli]MBB5217476.1 microcystin degradation protein MlrC [Parapusillimonas granuli]NYT50032.1 M81 family metallopeptidase [Parapusillimonas granuli]